MNPDDVGSMFTPKDGDNGTIKMDKNFINEEGNQKGHNFAKELKKEFGLENFTKFVLFHEVGHYIDYIQRINCLQDNKENVDLKQKDFTDHEIYNKYFDIWIGTTNLSNEIFKKNIQENFGDCLGCVLLAQNQTGNHKYSLKQIVNKVKTARKLEHQNNESSEYATFNALDRLLFHIKNIDFSSLDQQKLLDIVNKSVQEGLIMNIKAVLDKKEHQHLKESFIQDFPKINNAEQFLTETVNNSVRGFKL